MRSPLCIGYRDVDSKIDQLDRSSLSRDAGVESCVNGLIKSRVDRASLKSSQPIRDNC